MQEKKYELPKIDRSHLNDSNSKSKSNLASRLYRNSSLNRINPNASMLSSNMADAEPSYLNASINHTQNQLVASISLRKLKKKTPQEPYLEISNGKLLINQRRNFMNESNQKVSPGSKKLFKKLDKISYSPTNKILPDDLIDYTIEREELNDTKMVKKSVLNSPKAKNNKFVSYYQEKDNLFPEDFIQLLNEEKNITNEFCYLKKMQHPYDLKIVEFDKNLQKKDDSKDAVVEYPSQYITISSRGVTYFSSEQSRFVPLNEWQRQANYFKKIIKLDFFKNFRVIKNFSNWKKYLRKSAMKSTIEKLKQKLIYNDKFLRSSILQIRKHCHILQTDVSYCRLDDCQKVANFKQFKAAQQSFIQNEFQRRIFEIEDNIKQVLISHMSDSMKQFKEENKISSSIEGKGMPLLIGDEKNLEMPYTKEATLRTQQQKFQKFVKLIDLLITHSKVVMMSESTSVLSKKIDEQNQNYEKQVVESGYKNTYKGKQYLQCILSLDCIEPALYIRPTKQDLASLFEDIVNRSVVRLCRNHKKITSDIDVLSIIYDSQEQFPRQNQSESLKAIMTSDGRQEEMLRMIMSSVMNSYTHIINYAKRFKDLATVNFKNIEKMQEIEHFEPKDYQVIRNLLEKWNKQKEAISLINKEHEGPLFELNLRQFKEKAEKTTNDCISKVKQVIPRIFQTSMRELQRNLLQASQQIEKQPLEVKSLIIFNQNKARICLDIEQYSDRMLEITCLELLMRNMSPSSSQPTTSKRYEKDIKNLQTCLNNLRRKIDESDINNKLYETRAQQEVKQMIPKNKTKLAEFYNRIEILSRQKQSARQITNFIQKKKAELNQISKQFEDIRTYQRFLNLEESDPHQMRSFQEFFKVYQKIWSTANDFATYKQQIETSAWGFLKVSDVSTRLEQFITTFLGLQKLTGEVKDKEVIFQFTSHDHDAIKQVLHNIEELKPLIEAVQCLNDKTLGDKQWKQIKGTLESRNPRLLRVLQQDKLQTKTIELKMESVASELTVFKSIVVRAKKSSEIASKYESVRTFSNFSKQHLGLFRNLAQKFQSHIGEFFVQLDEKLIMTNFIQQENQSGEQKARTEKNNLEKLKEILVLWEQYEKHVQYFEPIYASMDWKNTYEAKLFISATQQNWKKTCKTYKDSNLLKVLTSQKILPSLKESNEVLESLYPSMNSYFNSKRIQSVRLCFLSDKQIVGIYSQNKDFRGFNNYINKVFPTVKSLVIKQQEQNPTQAINLDGEVLTLKLGRVSNYEVDEMIKAIQQGIKSGVKASFKNCYVTFDTDQFNKIGWIKENPLQALVFITEVYFTKIIEQDYLSSEGDNLDKLYNYHMSHIHSLRRMIIEESHDAPLLKKLLVLLSQSLQLRDTLDHLITHNITNKQSYDWVKQVRHYYSSEQPTVEYLNVSVSYGNEFVNLASNPLLTLGLNQRNILQIVNSLLCCNLVPIVNKSFLSQLCTYNGKPYNNVKLATGKEVNVLDNAIIGTWLSGSFTDMHLQHAGAEQLRQLAKLIQQVQTAVSLKEPYLPRGAKNLLLNKESAICIVAPLLGNSPLLAQFRLDYRVFTVSEVSWLPYVQTLFELYSIQLPQLAKKIARVLMYLENALPELRLSRRDFNNWLACMAADQATEASIPRLLQKKINRKELKQATRKFISKAFLDVFNIANMQQINSVKSIRDNTIIQTQVNKIVAIFKENKVCVISSPANDIRDYICMGVRKTIGGGSLPRRFLLISEENFASLLGHYDNGKWIDGLLAQALRSHDSQKGCLVLSGKSNRFVLGLLQILNSIHGEESYVLLENGQKLALAPEQKVLFLTETKLTDPLFNQYKRLKIHALQHVKFLPEESFDYLTKQKTLSASSTFICRHFQNSPQIYNTLRNIYLNNMEKFNSSNLKTLGYRNEFIEPDLIMARFVTLINAALTRDQDSACKSNTRMLEKMYIWSLFWCIWSSLPLRCLEKLEKILDVIKIEYDKSQSLSVSRLFIAERTQTISKFIKGTKIFQLKGAHPYLITPEKEAKTQLIKLLAVGNNHILLMGDKGSGKTCYLQYLDSVFKAEGYTVLKAKITHRTTREQFVTELKTKMYIQYFPSKPYEKYRLSSVTGKKLVIILDNFNLMDPHSSLCELLESATTYGYYYDTHLDRQIFLGDVMFVYSVTNSFEYTTKEWARKLFPIYIIGVELLEIINSYAEGLSSIANEELREMVRKILPSVASLHTSCQNLMTAENDYQGMKMSYAVPLWIARELIERASSGNYSAVDIITQWKYLTQKKYIESGLASCFRKQIEGELNILLSLITKHSGDMQAHLTKQKQLVKKLAQEVPLANLSGDNSDYYHFVAYVLSSCQAKHVLSSNCTAPAQLRIMFMSEMCRALGMRFTHVSNTLELTQAIKQGNGVVFVEGTDRELLENVFATIARHYLNTDVAFIINVHGQTEYQYYRRFYPAIDDLVHVHNMLALPSYSRLEIPDYHFIDECLQKWDSSLSESHYQRLFWQITQMKRRLKQRLGQMVGRKRVSLATANRSFKVLAEAIEDVQAKMENLQLQIKSIVEQEQNLMQMKNEQVEILSKLKKASQTEQNSLERQSANKKLAGLDAEIKKVKSLRSEKSEALAKLRDSFRQKNEAYTLLSELKDNYHREQQIFTTVFADQKTAEAFNILNAFVFLHFGLGNNQLYSKILDTACTLAVQKFGTGLAQIYSIVLGTQITDIKHQFYLIQWLVSSYQVVFTTSQPDKLVQSLQSRVPQTQLVTTQNEFNQFVGVRPTLSRDLAHWGNNKLSVVVDSKARTNQNTVAFAMTQEEAIKDFAAKIYEALCARNSDSYINQINFTKLQSKRLQSEYSNLSTRLREKVESDKSNFLLSNCLSELKQLHEARTSIKNRINCGQEKVKALSNEMEAKYGQIVKKSISYKKYINRVAQLYDYANFNEQQFIQIILQSLAYTNNKTTAECAEQEKQVVIKQPIASQLVVPETLEKLFRKVIRWICQCLKPKNFLQAYFLLACNEMADKEALSSEELQEIGNLFTKQPIKVTLATNNNKLNDIIKAFNESYDFKYLLLMQFGDNALGTNCRSIINNDQGFLGGLCTLMEENVVQGVDNRVPVRNIYVAIGSSQLNCYKVLDKQIKKYLSNDQTIFYVSENENITGRIESLQKVPSAQQGWIVLADWSKSENIRKVVGLSQTHRNYRVLFLFQSNQAFQQVKECMESPSYYQFYLFEKSRSLSYQILRLLAKLDTDKHNPDASKVLRMVAYDQIARLLKGLTDPRYRSNSYSYRIVEYFLNRGGKVTAKDIQGLALDYLYDDEQSARLFAREARKICKSDGAPEIFDDGFLPQVYSQLSEGYQQLRNKLHREDRLKVFIDSIVPEQQRKLISIDYLILNGQSNGLPAQTTVHLEHSKSQFKQQISRKLAFVLQRAPILHRQEETSDKVTALHIDLLKEEKKLLQNQYSHSMQILKKLSKITNQKVHLSNQTEGLIESVLSKDIGTILEEFLDKDRRIQALQKQIQGKEQLNLYICLDYINRPKQFLYAFAFETQQHAKIDWSSFQLHIRVHQQKQKQGNEKHEHTTLSNLRLVNAKFDAHKCQIESYGAGEMSKINIASLYLGKEDHLAYSRRIPFQVNGHVVLDINMSSRGRELGFWGCQPYVTVPQLEKQESRQN